MKAWSRIVGWHTHIGIYDTSILCLCTYKLSEMKICNSNVMRCDYFSSCIPLFNHWHKIMGYSQDKLTKIIWNNHMVYRQIIKILGFYRKIYY